MPSNIILNGIHMVRLSNTTVPSDAYDSVTRVFRRYCNIFERIIISAGRYRVLGIRYHEQRYRYRLLTWYRLILAPGFSAMCATLLFLVINFFVKQLEIQQTIKITIKRKYANLSIKNGDLNLWAVGLVATSFGLHKVVLIFSAGRN